MIEIAAKPPEGYGGKGIGSCFDIVPTSRFVRTVYYRYQHRKVAGKRKRSNYESLVAYLYENKKAMCKSFINQRLLIKGNSKCIKFLFSNDKPKDSEKLATYRKIQDSVWLAAMNRYKAAKRRKAKQRKK